MWNKYYEADEKDRQKLLFNHLYDIEIGDLVKTNEKHYDMYNCNFNGVVDDIDAGTGILVIHTNVPQRIMNIHVDYLEKIKY